MSAAPLQQRHPPGAYQKLANTPLSQASQTICGVDAKVVVIILGVLSIILNAGSYIFMGYYAHNCAGDIVPTKPPKRNSVHDVWKESGFDHDFDEKGKAAYDEKLPLVTAIVCYSLGGFLAIGIVAALTCGWETPVCACCWYCMLITNASVRLIILLIVLLMKCAFWYLNIIFLIADVVMVILVKMSWGIMINRYRRNKYLNDATAIMV